MPHAAATIHQVCCFRCQWNFDFGRYLRDDCDHDACLGLDEPSRLCGSMQGLHVGNDIRRNTGKTHLEDEEQCEGIIVSNSTTLLPVSHVRKLVRQV